MSEPQDSERTTPLVPPTPVTPEVYQPKRKEGDNIGIGIVLGILIDIVAILLVTSVRFIGSFGITAFLAIMLLAYGGSVAIAYHEQRPLLARGLIIMLGITIGLPLLAFGVCMALWQLS